ncbi:hypothetical protein KAFR_0F01030 [Kazachstania africana CBS 2517]|uniref:GTPase-activating protein GYP5 n=1 Tax=Kazachstania africana (strain ATCC 22294 / BCRC 22015 / CBS 2517 / CECT 1963 / NBRC 1671 / NRRL Y-8276) TaxID=1071382 RepID=H2AWE9_KAZAF|nr:hypothetical protein KAFR_0F01030 [Kazachstania africana CBS 2517]CCF58699.1 hypothetical protein KAFR_0F01030 [Kazachstania africana CBS 2517]
MARKKQNKKKKAAQKAKEDKIDILDEKSKRLSESSTKDVSDIEGYESAEAYATPEEIGTGGIVDDNAVELSVEANAKEEAEEAIVSEDLSATVAVNDKQEDKELQHEDEGNDASPEANAYEFGTEANSKIDDDTGQGESSQNQEIEESQHSVANDQVARFGGSLVEEGKLSNEGYSQQAERTEGTDIAFNDAMSINEQSNQEEKDEERAGKPIAFETEVIPLNAEESSEGKQDIDVEKQEVGGIASNDDTNIEQSPNEEIKKNTDAPLSGTELEVQDEVTSLTEQPTLDEGEITKTDEATTAVDKSSAADYINENESTEENRPDLNADHPTEESIVTQPGEYTAPVSRILPPVTSTASSVVVPVDAGSSTEASEVVARTLNINVANSRPPPIPPRSSSSENNSHEVYVGDGNDSSAKVSPPLPSRTSHSGPAIPPLPSRKVAFTSSRSSSVSRSISGNERSPSETVLRPVPPALSEEMKSDQFRKNLASLQSNSQSPRHVSSPIESAAEVNLIVNRFRATSYQIDSEVMSKRENIEAGQILLKSTFNTIVQNEENIMEVTEQDDDELKKIADTDWSFWTRVVNDFGEVANAESERLEEEITKGIPRQIRGIIWQLIANSKSKEYEDIYETLSTTESPHQASINRDLKRTNFVPHDKIEPLLNILSTYSVYDPDVGYTQGMAFIAAPLLLNCESEADAFGLLVVLMKNYGLREFFLEEMPGLMLTLYQFDRLLEETSPVLFNHLTREGVRSSMYATQWFLTLFAYKFPLEFVLRILDVVFVEGVESTFKFAVNLMLKNQLQMLELKFDQLLNFLKNELFEYYLRENHQTRSKSEAATHVYLERSVTPRSQNSNRVNNETTNDSHYDVDLFVNDAMEAVHITPISLGRYAAEYDEIHQIEHQREAQYEAMRIKNQQLQKEATKLRRDYAQLSTEHINIANELIENRLKIETLLDENNDLKENLTHLEERLQEEIQKESIPNPDAALKSDLKQDLERTMERTSEVMEQNLELKEKIKVLENSILELKKFNKKSARQISSIESSLESSPANLNVPAKENQEVPKSPSLTGRWTGFKKVFRKD